MSPGHESGPRVRGLSAIKTAAVLASAIQTAAA